jgi:SEC-C motif-containing protein
MNCPCGSQKSFTDCCEPIISFKKKAPNPETLMRARYTAYVKCQPAFLRETLAPSVRADFSEADVLEWSQRSEWLGLEIIKAQGAIVEFTAKYQTSGKTYEHHEVSTFSKVGDSWYFLNGESHVHEDGHGHHDHPKQDPIVRTGPKVGRNDACPCGSGKKFKKCCAA